MIINVSLFESLFKLKLFGLLDQKFYVLRALIQMLERIYLHYQCAFLINNIVSNLSRNHYQTLIKKEEGIKIIKNNRLNFLI